MPNFDMRDSGSFCEDGTPIPKGAISDPRHCWGPDCKREILRNCSEDPPYGLICNLCQMSLKQHPFFGKGKKYDKGNEQCVASWKALTKQQKEQVYIRNGFQPPAWLLR